MVDKLPGNNTDSQTPPTIRNIQMDRPVSVQPKSPFRRRDLNIICFVLLVIAIIADLVVAFMLGSSIIFGYSGGSDPRDVSGLGFLIAIYLFVVYGLPAAGVTALVTIAYQKTKPQGIDSANHNHES